MVATLTAMGAGVDVDTAAHAASTALDNNFLMSAVAVAGLAVSAYDLYTAYKEGGLEGFAKELGIQVTVAAAGVGAFKAGQQVFTWGGRHFATLKEAISTALDNTPGLKLMLGKTLDAVMAGCEAAGAKVAAFDAALDAKVASAGAKVFGGRTGVVETIRLPEMRFGEGIQKQGLPFENYVATQLPDGARLPPNFKTFDFYEQSTGIATSVKTLDTTTAVRQADPSQVYTTLKRSIDKTVGFDIGRLDGVELTKKMIAQRRVWVGVPETTGVLQWEQIQRAINYGTSQGVDVKIFKVGH